MYENSLIRTSDFSEEFFRSSRKQRNVYIENSALFAPFTSVKCQNTYQRSRGNEKVTMMLKGKSRSEQFHWVEFIM